MVLYSSKIGDGKNIFFKVLFHREKIFFLKFFLLVSNVKLCEIYDRKRKKSQKSFSHGKKVQQP
jgi:hypothetical protein